MPRTAISPSWAGSLRRRGRSPRSRSRGAPGCPCGWRPRSTRPTSATTRSRSSHGWAPHVRFVGEITEDEKPAFYAGARATLFPSDWPEPFGLVMIESLAAGTPVIALRRGAVPEVIEDGVTGFICDDVDEMTDAIGRIGEIDPEACRRGAARFSAERMCRGYVDVYRSLLGSGPRSPDMVWPSSCSRDGMN